MKQLAKRVKDMTPSEPRATPIIAPVESLFWLGLLESASDTGVATDGVSVGELSIFVVVVEAVGEGTIVSSLVELDLVVDASIDESDIELISHRRRLEELMVEGQVVY